MAHFFRCKSFQLFPLILLLVSLPLTTAVSGFLGGVLASYYLSCPGPVPAEVRTRHGNMLSLQEFCLEMSCRCLRTGQLQCAGLGVEIPLESEFTACEEGCQCISRRWYKWKGSNVNGIPTKRL
jgi:hypothetical protein